MIVVDASVVVKALLHGGAARDHLASAELHAPELLDLEVVSALRQQHPRAGRVRLARG